MADETKFDVFKKKFDTWASGVVIGSILSIVISGFVYREADLSREKIARNHIAIVTLTDKNCNDCHLGASFVNLFNHKAVKSNDNVVLLMLDKAKIKRW